jgi:hypothetical protein
LSRKGCDRIGGIKRRKSEEEGMKSNFTKWFLNKMVKNQTAEIGKELDRW